MYQFRGTFVRGNLDGTVKEIYPQDASIREVSYVQGIPSGTYRHQRLDGLLMSYGDIVKKEKANI